MRASLACLVVVTAALGCRPDLPGRGCKTVDDCFRTEVCLDGTCVDKDKLPTADSPAADAAPDEMAADAAWEDAAGDASSAPTGDGGA